MYHYLWAISQSQNLNYLSILTAMQIRQGIIMTAPPLWHTLYYLALIPSPGCPRNKKLLPDLQEAEYKVVATTTSKLFWIRSLLHKLKASIQSAPVIYYDNVGTTYICANPILHSKMKHIKVDFHFVR